MGKITKSFKTLAATDLKVAHKKTTKPEITDLYILFLWLYLPLAEAPKVSFEMSKDMSDITQDTPSRFGRILLVDDNEDIVDILKETILSHTTLEVLTATGAREGLSLLEENQVDVIILDLIMPVMDGIDMFKLIRNRSINVPVIFLTGKGDGEKQELAFQLGAFDFLEKPVKARDLLLLIDEAFTVVQKIRVIDAKKNAG